MKKQERIGFILVLSLILVGTMIFQANGQEKPKQEMAPKGAEVTIVRSVIGTGVENREPLGVAETFPAATEKVCCFLEATHISSDTEVSLIWFHGEKEMGKFSLPLKTGPRWRTYAFKNLGGLKGDWKVEIRDVNGNLLKENKFKVE
jgi:hypothetical protein